MITTRFAAGEGSPNTRKLLLEHNIEHRPLLPEDYCIGRNGCMQGWGLHVWADVRAETSWQNPLLLQGCTCSAKHRQDGQLLVWMVITSAHHAHNCQTRTAPWTCRDAESGYYFDVDLVPDQKKVNFHHWVGVLVHKGMQSPSVRVMQRDQTQNIISYRPKSMIVQGKRRMQAAR